MIQCKQKIANLFPRVTSRAEQLLENGVLCDVRPAVRERWIPLECDTVTRHTIHTEHVRCRRSRWNITRKCKI